MMKLPFLLESFTDRWDTYRRKIKRCRQEFSEDAVHDVRVAARRLRAMLDIARSLEPHRRIRKVRRVLKRQLDGLDDLRDVQVMLVKVAETIQTLPQGRALQGHLEQRAQPLMHSARARLDATRPSDLKRRMRKIRGALGERTYLLAARLLQVVDDAYSTTMGAYGQMDPNVPSSLHRLRIEFRKVRYFVEIIHPLLPGYPEGHFTRMHEYQRRMGEIRDTEMLLGALADCAARDVSFDPEPIRRHYQERHARLISSYIEGKGEIAAFWRAASDRSFPWEGGRATSS